MRAVVVWALLFPVVWAAVGARAAQPLVPVAVPFASGPAFPQGRTNGRPPDPQYSAAAAIDGNPDTFCCLLDDTLTGSSDTTIPARAAAPVTGYMVFDLGRPHAVLGIRLTGRKDAGGLNPREVDFFHFADDSPASHRSLADIEGDPGIRPLATRVNLPPLGGGRSESIFWDGAVARFLGMRVRSSYESGPVHFNFQLAEVAVYASPQPPNSVPGFRLPPLYVKRDSLTETLLACRERYAALWLPPAVASDENRRREGRQNEPCCATGSASARLAEDAGADAAAERLWEQLRRDFPPAANRWLDVIPANWFGSRGWLAQTQRTDLERNLVEQSLRETGVTGRPLRRELEALIHAPPPPHDRRWLDLCARASEVALVLRDVRALEAAIDDLTRSFGQRYRGDEYRQRLEAIRQRLTEAAGADGDHRLARLCSLAGELEPLKRDALVLGNPLLSQHPVLFVKRYTYSPGWYYAEFMRASRFGGNLCRLSLADGRVTELVPQLAGGIFDRYDLSFDGRRVAFAYKAAPGKGFRLWEVGVDGTGLRQLTFDPPDEPQRIEKYWHPQMRASGVYRHHTDDFHPCYLPDGGIAFASTRCERGVLCDQGDSLAVNTLYRMNHDGSGLRPLSEGALSESTPSVLNDGRILYTRWEYVDKGVIAVQSLWAMHPDGTQSTEVYGNDIELPPVLIHGRQIPGCDHRFVCTCTMHHPFAVGPIALIDTRRNIRTTDPIRYLTPETGLSLDRRLDQPFREQYAHWRNGRWVPDNIGPLYSEPFPLADADAAQAGAGKYFLVDCNPDRAWNDPAAYGLYLIDVFGNRVRIYHDPQISCWQPMPLRPRPMPPIIPDAPPPAERPSAPEATVLLSNVYAGMDGVEPGAVKYLRIWEQVPRPWAARRFWPGDETLGQHAVISLNAHIHVKILHGIVPVREDGSACFVVPAARNIFFQALDEDYMEVQRMRTFVNFQPGESRGCVGCHQPRSAAPPAHTPLAWQDPPVRPGPQPGETVPRPLHYPTDVQPILDRHCARCHNAQRTDGGLDLSGSLTTFFNRSYENIMRQQLVACIQEFIGPDPHAQTRNVEPLPPRALGARASRLMAVLLAGHYDVKLTREEHVRLATWLDANGPYYGSYFGRRNLVYKDHPDFRPIPTLDSARGLPPAE
jgi:hypothetical protein